MSKLRQAILQAADWIEKNPASYEFCEIRIPSCGTTGCMVGWVAHFLNIKEGGDCWGTECEKIIGVSSNVYMSRIHDLNKPISLYGDAKAMARCMRLYADKYHPASPLPTGSAIALEIMARPFNEEELNHA